MTPAVDLVAQKAPATLSKRRLILFVHGLGGDAESTWGSFPDLIRADADLVTFTVVTHEYPTARWRLLGKASVQIEQLAQELSTKLDTTFAGYDEIVIAAHSMGGVIVRKMLVERAKREKLDRIKAIVLYAVPNMGSSIATLGAMLSRGHRHLAQLKTNSAFLNSLNEDWAALGCGRRVAVRHVVGGQDKIVPHHSSRAPWAGAELDAVSDADHGSIVKPPDTKHLSYDILKRAALDVLGVDAPQPASVVAAATADPLFWVYSTEQEPFYVQRSDDGRIAPSIRHQNVWVAGPVGCGKTVAATRALLREQGDYRVASLGLAAGGGDSDVIRALHAQIARAAGIVVAVIDDGQLVDAVVDALAGAGAAGIPGFLVEEIPLPDAETLSAFCAAVRAIVVRHAIAARGRPVRLIFSSVLDPTNHFTGDNSAAESVTVIRMEGWKDVDLRRLIALLAQETGISIDEPQIETILSSAKGSPRFVKMLFLKILTAGREGPDAFEISLAAVQAEITS